MSEDARISTCQASDATDTPNESVSAPWLSGWNPESVSEVAPRTDRRVQEVLPMQLDTLTRLAREAALA